MPTFIALSNFTDQGLKTIKDSPGRAAALKGWAKKSGVTVREIFWTLGKYDMLAIWEAEDELSVRTLCLQLGLHGMVRTQTIRALTQDDMSKILSNLE